MEKLQKVTTNMVPHMGMRRSWSEDDLVLFDQQSLGHANDLAIRRRIYWTKAIVVVSIGIVVIFGLAFFMMSAEGPKIS